MASPEEGRSVSVSSIRRFPEEIREQLNRVLHRSSWQCLTREFSVDILTGLEMQALDDIADFVDSDYPEFQEDVRKRLKILKNTRRGKTQSFKGKSRVGFHSYFYRYSALKLTPSYGHVLPVITATLFCGGETPIRLKARTL